VGGGRSSHNRQINRSRRQRQQGGRAGAGTAYDEDRRKRPQGRNNAFVDYIRTRPA
jgi:hypothetical protein